MTIYGMQPQPKFFITSSDKVTFEVPQELIHYFGTFKAMQEDLGPMATVEDGGFPFPHHSAKTLKFILKLATAYNVRGNIQDFLGEILLFNDSEITELLELIKFLEPIEPIVQALRDLIGARIHAIERKNQSKRVEDTVTIKAGDNIFLLDKSLIAYIGTIQNMIAMLGKDLKTITELSLPSNSLLTSTDPAVFNAFTELLEFYHRAQNEQEGQFDFQPLFKQFMQQKNYSTQTLLELMHLINYLEVTVLYEPLLDLLASYLEQGKIEKADPLLNELGDENSHYIKGKLVKALMYEFQSIAMRKARPKAKITINAPGVYATFSRNGLYACTYGAKKISLVDFEQKKVFHSFEMPFIIHNCVLSDDGTLIFIYGKEGKRERLYSFDLHNKTLNPVISFSAPVTIQGCALSPDNKKLCVITSENRVLILTGDKFAHKVADFTFAELKGDLYFYTISWFPPSSKLLLTAEEIDVAQYMYIVGAMPETYNTNRQIGMNDSFTRAAVPLDRNRLLIIPNYYPYVVTFDSQQQLLNSQKEGVTLPYNQIAGDLYKAVLSTTGKYVLIFAGNNLMIMETETGLRMRGFNTIFPAQFNKDDTGLWAYDAVGEQFVFYPFRNAANFLLENTLFKLHWPSLKMVIDICKAMKSGERVFAGFSDDEKKILLKEEVWWQKGSIVKVGKHKIYVLEKQ